MRVRLVYLTLLIPILLAAAGSVDVARTSASADVARTTPSAAGAHQARAGSALAAKPSKALAEANTGFGKAVIQGPDAAINAYATPALLSQAPDRHLINLLHLLNIPGSYAWHINAYDGRSAAVTMSWIFSAGSHSTTINDRLLWMKTASGWRIAKITYLNTTSV